VVLPIEGADWETAKAFAQALALALAADQPKLYVAKIAKSLRAGKIFVDYLRNTLEQTSAAVYSTRARAGAPVAVPVTWQELGRTTSADQYRLPDLMRRLGRLKRDPWRTWGKCGSGCRPPACRRASRACSNARPGVEPVPGAGARRSCRPKSTRAGESVRSRP
jgi:DNA primase